MKRFFIIALLVSLFMSQYAVLSAQNRIQSGMMINKVKIYKKEKKVLEPVKRGFQQSVTASFMSEFDECCRVGIDYIGGYRFNNCLYAGAGVGLNVDTWGNWDYFDVSTHTLHEEDEDWRYSIRNICSIPVYAHLRAYIGKKRCQPFAALSAGAHIVFPTSSVVIDIPYRGGDYTTMYNSTYLFMEPMLGMDVRINQRISVNLQVGLNLHGVSYMKMKDAAHACIYKRPEGDLSVKLGCTF